MDLETKFLAFLKLKGFIQEAFEGGCVFDITLKPAFLEEKLAYGITINAIEIQAGKAKSIRPAQFIIEADEINRSVALILKMVHHAEIMTKKKGGSNGQTTLITPRKGIQKN